MSTAEILFYYYLLCWIAVFFVMNIDDKNQSTYSLLVWIFFIWPIILITLPFVLVDECKDKPVRRKGKS